MASKISPCLLACVILFLAQNSAAKSLVPNCDYACKEKDLETEDGYHASGSAISSQFLLPDGSVVTNSKETSISSDGIKQTFHQLKKEADHFIHTGQAGPSIHPHLAPYVIPPAPSAFPAAPYNSPSGFNSHDTYSQTTKDRELEKKLLYSLSPSSSSNSQYNQFQAQNNARLNSQQSQMVCDICGMQHTGVSSGKSDATASYNTIVGNVPPSSASSSSSYQKHESASQQKNSSQQPPQPILFANSLKPNTFTTNIVDFNGNNYNNQNGQGSETHVSYQESGSGQVKTSERVISQPAYGLGPISHPSKVVVQVSGPSDEHSSSYQKQESSSHVQQSSSNSAAVPVPVGVFVQQSESELAKQQMQQQQSQLNGFRSPVLLGGVPQNVPLENGHSSYYSSSSSSSSKTVSSSDNSSPVIVHQSPPKYTSHSGYSSSNGGSYSSSQNAPEFYYNGNKIHGASSSIYDHSRGDTNAETLCTGLNCPPCVTCSTYVAGAPIKNSYGVATSYSSQSSTINGKTTENREAAVAVNDNGKVDSYRVKT